MPQRQGAISMFQILSDHRAEFLVGLWTTLKLCLYIWPIGILLGSALGAAGGHWKLAVGIPSRVLSFILSAVPVLVFLFWLHYPAQTMLGIVVEPFYTAVVALSALNTLTVADLMRNVLRDFPQQYVAVGRVYGLSRKTIALKIQLPIVARQVLPTLLMIQVSMLQASLFASLISVDEIFRVAQRINSEVYRPVEIYSALALLFLVVCLPLHGLASWLNTRFTRNISER